MPDAGEAAEPASPCTGVCTIHPRAGICAGCLRTLDEIAIWRDLDAAGKQAVLDALPGREALIRKRPRG